MVVVAQEAVAVVVVEAALKVQLVTDQEELRQLNYTEAGEAIWRILARFSGLSLNANNKKQPSQQYAGMCVGVGQRRAIYWLSRMCIGRNMISP